MNSPIQLRNGQQATVIKLTSKHLDPLISLQQQVIANLENPSFLQPLSIEEFTTILNGHGLIIGAMVNDKLIAFRAFLEPEIDEEHLGRDANLLDSELASVLYSEVTNVHPHYQGNGLQVTLGKILMQEIEENRFSYVCATVAPFNIASLKDKFALGMHIVALKEKYDGMLRYVLYKKISSDIPIEHATTKNIEMSNTSEQQTLLMNGWIGTELYKDKDIWFVRYVTKID